MLESGLVRAIIRAVLRQHPSAWVFKTVGGPYQVSGVPDLILCVNGRFLAFEVKHQKPGESLAHARSRATPQQRWQLRMIAGAGGTALVVTTADEVLAAIAAVADAP